MNKRYQVFVSSTFTDLIEERQKVIHTLLGADCIPAGMELFPAADDEQFNFIKGVIDDCDYYLLLIGGRYGSIDDSGISYTEKEYDYALSRNLKVMAFIHSDPLSRGEGRVESDPAAIEKLMEFITRVASGRLVKFWSSADELPGLVALSILNTIKMFPAVGWIRADQAASVETLTELNNARKEVEALKNEIAELQSSLRPSLPDLAGLDEIFEITQSYQVKTNSSYPYGWASRTWTERFTWREIFAAFAPELLKPMADSLAKGSLEKTVANYKGLRHGTISDTTFQTIKIQLQALGLVSIDYLKTTGGGMNLFWQLTSPGRKLMFESRTVRKDEEKERVTKGSDMRYFS